MSNNVILYCEGCRAPIEKSHQECPYCRKRNSHFVSTNQQQKSARTNQIVLLQVRKNQLKNQQQSQYVQLAIAILLGLGGASIVLPFIGAIVWIVFIVKKLGVINNELKQLQFQENQLLFSNNTTQ